MQKLIHDTLKQHPGSNLSQLATKCRMGNGEALDTLKSLEAAGLVRREGDAWYAETLTRVNGKFAKAVPPQ